jgi:hypothetical protein
VSSSRAAGTGVALLVALTCASLPAAAADGPGCTAGACVDADNDGFVACGCPTSGTPCDCDDADPNVYPNAPEACDARKDLNCNGVAREPCAQGYGCTASLCVPECIPLDDFGCPGGSHFDRPDGGVCLCAPDDCATYGCAPGFTCDDAKQCVPNCSSGVVCPRGQRCLGIGCVDPCAGISCPEGAACVDGRCTPSCACDGGSCAAGETCDPAGSPPTCVETACVGITCPAGAHCEQGTCRDDCEGVVCPPERVCRVAPVDGGGARGQCVDLCSPDPCGFAFTCDWRTGTCTPRPVAEGGLTPIPVDPNEVFRVVGGGWTCNAGTGASATAGLLTFGALFAGLRARRRRR